MRRAGRVRVEVEEAELSPEAAVVLGRQLPQFRREAANKVVRNDTLISLVAGLEPIPLVDIPILLGNQIRLILRVAAIYGEQARHLVEGGVDLLLLETMQKSGYSAIAKITMHQREYTVVVRPNPHGLMLHTMFYPEEVREVPEFGRNDNVTVKPQEVALAEKLVEGLAADFDPSKYHDEYQERLKQLIEAKREGQTVEAAAPKRRAPVIDLMQALQKSLGELPQRKHASKAAQNEADASATKKQAAAKRQPAKVAHG